MVETRSTHSVDIRRAGERFHTKIHWLDSWHSFSFAEHYDPDNVGHGLLLVNNDDIVAPGTGFHTHPHRDMEIVTWVLDGQLEHRDSEGNRGVIYPGLAQRMSAGSGIRHSEMNARHDIPVRLVQMWVPPDTLDLPPGYEQKDVTEPLNKGGLVPVASGRGHEGAVLIHQKNAVLWAGRLKPGETAEVPASAFAHVFAAKGSVRLGDAVLDEGDAARLTRAGALPLAAGKFGAEVLIWEMTA